MTNETDADAKRFDVQEQQRPIAEWMAAVMRANGLGPTKWAVSAGLGRDTVSRAVKENYKHVTSTNTLIKLARAAGVSPPLDLGATPHGVPKSAVLAEILAELLKRLSPEREWPTELTMALGKAMRHTLLELAEDPDQGHQPDKVRMAARISARQQSPADSAPPNQESE